MINTHSDVSTQRDTTFDYPANAQLLELGDVSHVLGDKATATTHPELPTR